MPLPIMTPIRIKFCADVRKMYKDKYHIDLDCADFRIIDGAQFFDMVNLNNADDTATLLDFLYHQYAPPSNSWRVT